MREPLTVKLLWATVACMLLTLLPQPVQLALVQWPLDFAAAQGGSALAVLGNFRPWQLATHVLVNSLLGLILGVAPVLYFFGAPLEGMFDGAPLARKFAGECGSVLRRTLSSSGVKLRRHTVAQFNQKRWFSV